MNQTQNRDQRGFWIQILLPALLVSIQAVAPEAGANIIITEFEQTASSSSNTVFGGDTISVDSASGGFNQTISTLAVTPQWDPPYSLFTPRMASGEQYIGHGTSSTYQAQGLADVRLRLYGTQGVTGTAGSASSMVGARLSFTVIDNPVLLVLSGDYGFTVEVGGVSASFRTGLEGPHIGTSLISAGQRYPIAATWELAPGEHTYLWEYSVWTSSAFMRNTPDIIEGHLDWNVEMSFINPDGGSLIVDESQILPALIGDINGDGFVGAEDLDPILAQWGDTLPAFTGADIDGDGSVGQADLDLILGNWGAGTPPAAGTVPEPAGAALLGLGLLALQRRRR